jgi:predicted O-methyltransferase YrrM
MISIDQFIHTPYALSGTQLPKLFHCEGKLAVSPSNKSLDQWKMEEDDAPIFKFIYEVHGPRRHLEFGTWQGWGTVLCLESCAATVWTINMPDGESRSDGSWAYGERVLDASDAPQNIVTATCGEDNLGPKTYHRTDARDYIGHIYREKGLGNRVCQIYCDSRDWDCSNYPADFFDSVLIDGGHHSEVVVNDTRKSLQVLRPGGIVMWHDFCPFPEIRSQFETVKGVTEGIESMLPELDYQLKKLYWIDPSWILLGIKK